MPARRGPLSCDQLQKRYQNARKPTGASRSLSSAIRKGCAWSESMPPPNPCEPKPRAFVTKKDKEVAFVVSGGDCPPGVKALVTELHKALVKDARESCTGTRGSPEFKTCVVDKFRRGIERRPSIREPMPMEPVPVEMPPMMGPPPVVEEIAPRPPTLPDEPDRPSKPPPPTKSADAMPLSPAETMSLQDEIADWLSRDYPRLQPPKIPDQALAAYLASEYAKLPDCDRMLFRFRPTHGVAFGSSLEGAAKRQRTANLLLTSYPKGLPRESWVRQGSR